MPDSTLPTSSKTIILTCNELEVLSTDVKLQSSPFIDCCCAEDVLILTALLSIEALIHKSPKSCEEAWTCWWHTFRAEILVESHHGKKNKCPFLCMN